MTDQQQPENPFHVPPIDGKLQQPTGRSPGVLGILLALFLGVVAAGIAFFATCLGTIILFDQFRVPAGDAGVFILLGISAGAALVVGFGVSYLIVRTVSRLRRPVEN